MADCQFDIHGEAATFATRREREWKEAVKSQSSPPSLGGRERCLSLDFVVGTLAPGGHRRDLDNLVAPVLGALVNGVGWFGGSRPNILAWEASMAKGANARCRVEIHGAVQPAKFGGKLLVEGVYAGALPTGGKSRELAEWAADLVEGRGWRAPKIAGLQLSFGSGRINLGDIETGPLKSTIDCLWPWIGGTPGAPHDHVIRRLAVQKAVSGLAEGEVEIALWGTGRGPRTLGRSAVFHPTEPAPRPPAPTGKRGGNPCRPGTRKHLVCQAALERWSEKRTRKALDKLATGAGARLSEYMSDLRSDNGLQVMVVGGRLRIG